MSADEIAKPASHPFYVKVNDALSDNSFDRKVEHLCQRFYKPVMGRPSMAPGVYFRMLLIGYCEGIDSERGIAWRVADSLSLRQFLGFGVTEQTPDHSSVSRTRRLYSLEAHKAVFRWFVRVLGEEGLLDGQTVSIDGTTLEANAAMRSIRRRDDGRKYEEYLKGLAVAEGIENPTREQVARLDRKRKKKASNKDWMSPSDKDARIAKRKDGRTHLAHKAEHAVDLSSGADRGRHAPGGRSRRYNDGARNAERGAGQCPAGERARGGGVGRRQGLPQRRDFGGPAWRVGEELHSGAGTRAAAMARAGNGTTAGICQPAASAGPARQATAEAAVGADGTEFRSHVRNGRDEADAPERAR